MQQDGRDEHAAESRNVVWHEGEVPRAERERILGQRGATVWFTGLSGSGKSTIAVALERALASAGRVAYRIDGDNLRHGLNAGLGFSPVDRRESVRRAGEVCRILADAGVIALASLVSPVRADRDEVRSAHARWAIPFLEIHVDVPLAIAESRDPKGLYRRARTGEIVDLTGIHQTYERPLHPDAVIDSHRVAPAAAAAELLSMLEARQIMKAPCGPSAP